MRTLVLGLLVGLPTVAAAHHETGVTRVDGLFSGGLASLDLRVPAPRLELGIAFDEVRFGKVLRGRDRLTGVAVDGVIVRSVTPSAGVWVDEQTRFQVQVPTGAISRRTEGRWETSPSVGDLELSALRRVEIRPESDRPLSLFIEGAVSLPTGSYAEHALVSVDDVGAGDDGSLVLTTFDTRASMGAGAPIASLRITARQPIGKVELIGGLSGGVPLWRTPDGIRWGPDMDLRTGAMAPLREGSTFVRAEVDGRLHAPDGFAVPEPGEEATGRRVGGRASIGLSGGVVQQIGQRAACALQARLPAWQKVQGVQLVETVAFSARCGVSWGLRRRAAESGSEG